MNIIQGDQFQKEFKKLQKKYRTLSQDLEIVEKFIMKFPFGEDTRHCHQIKKKGEKCICKRRMMCRSVKGSEFRVLYYFDGKDLELIYLEIYYKGTKESEDTKRIESFWEKRGE